MDAESIAKSLGIDTSEIPQWQHQARVIRSDMVTIGNTTDPFDKSQACDRLAGDTYYAYNRLTRPYSDPNRSWTWKQWALVQSAIKKLNQAAVDCRVLEARTYLGETSNVTMAQVQSEVADYERT